MTNQLFRDYLDGREPLPSFRANFLRGITGPNRIAIRPMPEHREPMPLLPWQRDILGHLTSPDFVKHFLGEWTETPPPTDPRTRALWAKGNRGHGPAPDKLTKRGRVTNYKTKG